MPKDPSKLYPPKGRQTMKFSKLSQLSFCNSKKLPEFVDMGGIRKQWVGIGWIGDDLAHGDEVIITEDDGSLPERKVGRNELIKFWARGHFYNAFKTGGNCWEPKRYEMRGFKRICGGYTVYAAPLGDGSYTVFERSTGGSMCSGADMKKALAKARRLLKQTPDFEKQIKEHQKVAINTLAIIDTEEALATLRAKENEDRAKKTA